MVLIMLASMNGKVDLNTCSTGESFALYMLIATVIPLCLIILALQYPKATSGGVKTLSTGAPIIVGFNLFLLSLINHFRTNWYWNDFIGILTALVILIIFYPIIIVARKHFPIILGNRKIK